ncbi:PREDICTED: cytochrome c oxidase subunit 7A1, mitochondrial isoform X2 [Dipodomys ordii]|uniref:Cytochrome c oxidase subunit 7A1, mitochondrial n=1 Tax=Dipodomys ordii TaxID=10020 RepID=A0A1S3G0A4_DIPOR|nr:PREDICTED: cytochrome c oxidase subunit 7A1, mitochondrial isoform X2 [Dipodomys ordii]XP_042524020.1 cytochrome c oxidase subunit 7A1, mitochondrial [Dipodomys spectabilis]
MRALRVSQALIRSFCSTAQRNRVENRVPEKQKIFQEDNGLPVYLKGGRNDNILYLVTMVLTMGGTAYSLYFLAWAACPHKK